jgi:mannose-6-phosphate isomerase class I
MMMADDKPFKSNYDKYPEVTVPRTENQAWSGWNAIAGELTRKIRSNARPRTIIAVEFNSAVDHNEIRLALESRLSPRLLLEAADAQICASAAGAILDRDLGEDRVFGRMTGHPIELFFDQTRLAALKSRVLAVPEGLVIILGIGAGLVCKPDIFVYADLARREIGLRYRDRGFPNWLADNGDEEFLKKYKRGFFFEWRTLDLRKRAIFAELDYILDTNRSGDPAMARASSVYEGLSLAARRPFRLVPYFDPGPWGGQWMKTVCALDNSKDNYAWCFDCVPEENSIFLKIGGIRVELPSINLVFLEPKALLGDPVHARFGLEFPIRFDLLDTMEGGNLSLQVHPLTEYIQEQFGMHYTQDESYYILDAGEDASVYLGVRTGAEPQTARQELEAAQAGGPAVDVEEYVNRWPAKKHDHFLIPAGTIHCSGRNTLVLEISATPYIFTFKLWDWGRLGLDGRPRPIHLEHGLKNIQWDRDTSWTESNLINRLEHLAEGPGWTEERTGLHEREFIETRRTWFESVVALHTGSSVNVLNLVEGQAAVVESPTAAFEPFEVHYAETFIIPAAVGAFTLRPLAAGRHAVIRAWVRG